MFDVKNFLDFLDGLHEPKEKTIERIEKTIIMIAVSKNKQENKKEVIRILKEKLEVLK